MNSDMLAGKTAIVTGAGRGLGEAIAAGLTAAGAAVAAMSRTDAADALVQRGDAEVAIRADLADRAALRAGFDRAIGALGGRIDILVNCAGIQRRHECEDFPIDDWDEVLEVNLTATFELCQLAGRAMLARGRGKIINIASMLSFFGGIRVPAYAASKGGVMQLTRALANAWGGRGVQVNALAPGYMTTEMNAALLADAERSASILARIPAGRWGEPGDIVGPCLFLASDLSDYVNGAIIPVDGGYLSF
ncbi:MAG: SDR family oxidoreductase [Clostridiales bacterium]|nr:SDR family oxidoreductase [Clostridiales bacterium]